MSRFSSRFLLVASAILFLLSPARAQITGATNGTTTPSQGIGHDYIHMLGETVNPVYGSVSLRLQVPVPPGRRLTLPFSFNYDSNGMYTAQGDGNGNAYMATTSQYLMQAGWSYGLPLASNTQVSKTTFGYPTCYATTGYTFQDSGGTGYSFNKLVGFEHAPRTCLNDVDKTFDTTNDFYTGSITGFSSPLTVASLSNTLYTFNFGAFGGCGGGQDSAGSTLPATIEDRNGNIVSITGPPTTCNGSFTVSDTLGRTALSSSGFGSTGNTITVSGLTQPYTLTWGTAPATFNPGFTFDSGNSFCSKTFTGGRGGTVVKAITLPNSKQYTFSYDTTYGLLSKITYPTGGYVSYTWELNTRSNFTAVSDSAGDPQVCQYTYDTPALAHRYVSFDGSTIAEQQDFTYSTTWNPNDFTSWTTKTTIVTTHDLVNGTSFQTSYTYTPVLVSTSFPWLFSFFGNQIPVEQTTVYKGTNGTTLRTVAKAWYDQNEIKSEQTTLDNGQSALVNFTWAGGLITEKDEFDFGQTTTPTRKTLTTYVFDQPATIKVQDGNSNTLSETDTVFDATATTAVSNLPSGTHDETNYGPTSTRTRANATTVTKQCFPSCINSSTTFTYDETGQMLTSTDPNGHITQYSYADSYTVLSGGANITYTPSANTNAFLTKITNPLTQTQNFTYDFNNGQLTISKDQNALTTTYVYNDSLGRPTSTTRPDNGQTTVTYNDSTNTVATAKKINPTQTMTTVAIADGVGHVKQTQLTSDPQGTVYTDTTYDGLGRIRTVSNPYRSGSDPTTTLGTTTYFYDALSRKCLEVPPDGTLPTGNICPSTQPANDLFTTYYGSTTTVTDQTNRSRASATDGLGRLTQIFEDPAGVNYETDYVLDPLSNLLSVNQKGGSSNSSLWRTRTFTYDSLSRLVTSSNPEVGTITYKYDSDTNCTSPNSFTALLVSKTDARGIRTCVQYDAINREVVLNYSNGDPTVTTTYDQTSCLGLSACQNVGGRTSMTDAAGSEAWSYQVDSSNNRTIHVEQRTTESITKSSTYYLDQAGDVTQAVYPTGRTVNYTYNNADRPITAIDASNGITYATDFQTAPTGCLSNAVCYTPQGTFYALSIGQTSSFSGLNLSHSYNTRLQPLEFKASSAGGNAVDITYGYVDPVTTHNAGHVYSVTNNLDTTRSQNFTYDSLNRATSALTASTHASSPAHCWGETYSVDPWGNLQSIAATTNTNYTGCSQESGFGATADGYNHLSGFSYDASGNTLGDGTNNYTWNGESQMKTAAGVSYLYDGGGRRVSKSIGKLYWYGSGGDILAETDASGNTTAEYIFFGGKRVAMLPAGSTPVYYVEDMLGTSRVITTNTGAVCYDADFYPYGGERPYINACPQNYKFEGKERDTETGNDDFGARYYSNRFGRWLSADWSSIPAPVPYANLTNPQTLNLYSMVADDPESFADLDGHTFAQTYQVAPGGWSVFDMIGGSDSTLVTEVEETHWLSEELGVTQEHILINPTASVTEMQVRAQQLIIVAVAQNKVNSQDYLEAKMKDGYPAGADKCNQLVADTIQASGLPRPRAPKWGILGWLGFTRDPLSHEWADPNVHISGWSDPKPLAEAQPGDVIAQAHGNWGHVGIVVEPGLTVSVNSKTDPKGIVTRNPWGFRPRGQNGESSSDPAPVVRSYTGSNP
jgi:RHS repeat-associated protein